MHAQRNHDASRQPPAPARGGAVGRARMVAGFAAATLAASGCTSQQAPASSQALADPPGPGVVFSYPADGQYDVPAGARVLLAFSDPIRRAVDTACGRAGGEVTGTFCVEGPDGFVAGSVAVEGSTLAFTPAARLAPGATYKVWARPALLAGATNLPTATPLVTFRARSTRARGGEAATVLTVNGAPVAAAGGASAQPLLDAAPIRLVFSEPLDPTTLGSTGVRLVHAADGAAVDGVVLARGVHLTFQPAAALVAGDRYRLELTAAVRDLGGEAIAPVSVELTPVRTERPGKGMVPLRLGVVPPWTAGATPPPSRLGATPVNTNVLTSRLAGTNTMGVLAGGLDVLVGDPTVLGPALPMVIRRGQHLDLSSMPIRHGGALETGLETGTLHFTLLTDSVGIMRRNPFRDPAQVPDDARSPTWVDLTMDAVISTADARGNTLSTQTVLGIRVLGLSIIDGDQLAIDKVGALDLDVLGVEPAPVDMALRLRTGSGAPTPEVGVPVLVSTLPATGAVDVSPADPIALDFSGPLDPARIRDGIDVTLQQGATAIPTSTRLEGATVVLVPSRRLDEGSTFTVSYAGLRSLGGAPVAGGSVSFTTAATAAGKAAPPIVTTLVPGAPCALVASSAGSAGHCAGGKAGDGGYQPFTLPANRDVRAVFSQPVDPRSLTLGAACGQGSVRVERVGPDGKCAGVVAGSLLRRDRDLRFVASDPWTPGAAYRLTLVSGPDTRCDAGEICGRNGKPLEPDPLAGIAAGGGGPDLVVDFTGAPATIDVYEDLRADPTVDLNGNGELDAGEHASDRNRVALEIVGYGGFVKSATHAGADCLPLRTGQQACSYLTASLPSSIGGVLATCPIDATGAPSTTANPCLEAQIFPSVMLGTSTAMDVTADAIVLALPLKGLPTGMTVMRLRETGGPIRGYILREAGVADPQFVVVQDVYFDAPDLAVPVGTHDLHSKPLHVTLKGPVTFRKDGRMDVALRNTTDVSLRVNLTAAALLTGYIDLLIPAGEMRVTLAGQALR
jgi:hypothetical protein